jgi:hypothetical protein
MRPAKFQLTEGGPVPLTRPSRQKQKRLRSSGCWRDVLGLDMDAGRAWRESVFLGPTLE